MTLRMTLRCPQLHLVIQITNKLFMMSFLSVAPPHTNSDVAPATSSASALRIIPTTSLATDKQQFSPQSIGRLKALMSKESRTQTLIKVGAEGASTHFDTHTSQDEASYDGDISDADEEDIEVVPDKVDDTQIRGLKPVEAETYYLPCIRKFWLPDLTTTSRCIDKCPMAPSASAFPCFAQK